MGEGGLETCAFAEVTCSSDMVNVRLAGEGRVHFSVLVVCRGGGSDLGTINEEGRKFGPDEE